MSEPAVAMRAASLGISVNSASSASGVVRSTFWWLDYFADFARHLRSRYRCVFDSSAALVFDLRRSTEA